MLAISFLINYAACECTFILSRLSKSLDDFAAQIMQIKGSSAGDALTVEFAITEDETICEADAAAEVVVICGKGK